MPLTTSRAATLPRWALIWRARASTGRWKRRSAVRLAGEDLLGHPLACRHELAVHRSAPPLRDGAWALHPEGLEYLGVPSARGGLPAELPRELLPLGVQQHGVLAGLVGDARAPIRRLGEHGVPDEVVEQEVGPLGQGDLVGVGLGHGPISYSRPVRTRGPVRLDLKWAYFLATWIIRTERAYSKRGCAASSGEIVASTLDALVHESRVVVPLDELEQASHARQPSPVSML